MKQLTTLIISLFVFSSLIGQTYFPDRLATWESRSAVSYGIDTSVLSRAVAFAEASEYTGSRDLRQAIYKGFEREPYHQILGPTKKRGGPAGMIIKDGYVIAQWGDVQRVDMTFSVTKSYLSTMAGLAEDRGLISSVHDKVSDYIWDGKYEGEHNSKITWDHLLTQSSDWSGQLWGGYDWADRPPRDGGIDDWKYRKLNEPGAVFEYNDIRVNLLAYSLLNVWRKPLPQVLKEHIMDPIGASSTWRWYGYDNSWVDIDGQRMQSVSGGGHSGGGIFISAEDHARFGLLFLNNGNWNGQQLLSEEWVKKAIAPSKSNPSYGYMWWLNPNDPEDRMSNVSTTGYYAAGFGGNYIIIEPDHNMVIVARWLDPSKANEFMGLIKKALK